MYGFYIFYPRVSTHSPKADDKANWCLWIACLACVPGDRAPPHPLCPVLPDIRLQGHCDHALGKWLWKINGLRFITKQGRLCPLFTRCPTYCFFGLCSRDRAASLLYFTLILLKLVFHFSGRMRRTSRWVNSHDTMLTFFWDLLPGFFGDSHPHNEGRKHDLIHITTCLSSNFSVIWLSCDLMLFFWTSWQSILQKSLSTDSFCSVRYLLKVSFAKKGNGNQIIKLQKRRQNCII